ncbi:MAG: hypothetical protein AABX52_01460 [Nanoarchaeota archaeon]
MQFQKLVNRLKRSPEYKNYHSSHPKGFLAHIFVQNEGINNSMYQLGYYDPASLRMTTFIIGDDIQSINDQEILADPETQITPLLIKDVKADQEEIYTKAEEIREKMYPQSVPIKQFFIIQNSLLGPIFNITYLTQRFSTINIKISTTDLNVLKHNEQELMKQI